MNLPESDLEYCVRAFTRIATLCDRHDLGAEEQLRQIREQATEAVGRDRKDEEVIRQLKATIVEYRNKSIDLGIAQKEAAEAQAKLAASERSRSALEAQMRAGELHPDRFAALIRVEDLGCALIEAFGNVEAMDRGYRTLAALAKRLVRDLDSEERQRRGKSALIELLEG